MNGYSESTKRVPAMESLSPSASARMLLSLAHTSEFDIMDFNKPSLRKKPKGKQSIPDPVLSDSEFNRI